MSYPPGQQPPTWGGQQGGQLPPAWGQQQPPGWGPAPPVNYSPSPGGSGMGAAAIVAAFIGLLVLVAAVAAMVIFLNQPPAPPPACQPGLPCAPRPSLPPVSAATPTPRNDVGTPRPETLAPSSPAPSGAQPASPPPSGTLPSAPPSPAVPQPTPATDSPPVVLGGSTWRSATLGHGFEFDPGILQLSQSTDELALFDTLFFDGQIVVNAVTADVTPAEMIEQQLAIIDSFMIARVVDSDDYDAVLGPSIGYVNGQGAVYSGILLSSDGTPSAPGGVTLLASTDGRITVAVVVIVAQPDSRFGSDTVQHTVRRMADDILKTFDWGPAT